MLEGSVYTSRTKRSLPGVIQASVNLVVQALMAEISSYNVGSPVRKPAPSQAMKSEVWLTIIAPNAAKGQGPE